MFGLRLSWHLDPFEFCHLLVLCLARGVALLDVCCCLCGQFCMTFIIDDVQGLFAITCFTMASASEDETSTSTRKPHEKLVVLKHHENYLLQGHFDEQCARVNGRFMLVGKFNRFDVQNHISGIIRNEVETHGNASHYLGLATNKLHWRFHEMEEGSHFDRFRSIYLIYRGNNALVRKWETYLVPALKALGHTIQNSDVRGGSGIHNTKNKFVLCISARSIPMLPLVHADGAAKK